MDSKADSRERFPNGLPLEDFTPFHESLEARVGRAYWGARGGGAFIEREVPSDITNDGARASRAAEVLFARCAEVQDEGRVEDELRVVELGVGLGLFARLFVRRFFALCEEHGAPFHRRMVYCATDLSEQNLLDIERLGTLADLGARVRLGVLDALDPSIFRPLGGGAGEPLKGRLGAVLHNYLCDALPQSLLLRRRGRWYELWAQSILAEPWRLPQHTARPLDQLLDLVRRKDAAAVDALVEIAPLLDVDRAFFPAELEQVPQGALAERFADEVLQPHVDQSLGPGREVRFWLPWGAMKSLGATAELLAPGGLVLFTDYGGTSLEQMVRVGGYQRYGAGVCVPINFPLLDRSCQEQGFRVAVPEGDGGLPLHARLLTRRPLPRTEARFAERFAAGDFQAMEEHMARARQALDRDVPEALASFREAAELFPESWLVLSEWAHAETFQGGAPRKGLELAERALALNPTCSADLWCEQGDALDKLGQTDAAERAYRRALEVGPEHPRPSFNLARILADRGAHDDALEAIGQALLHDPGGQHARMLLDKQKEILDGRAAAHESDRQRSRLRGA